MNLAIIGAQWGDEGKGKIVHLLGDKFAINARGEGGNNAGHTVIHDGRELVLHLIPSAIAHPNTKCILGRGMVINPMAFRLEVEELLARGIKLDDRLFVSERATLITHKHLAIEAANAKSGASGIGTTMRGIGPAYEERRARTALLAGHARRNNLKQLLTDSYLLTPEIPGAEVWGMIEEFVAACEFLRRFLTDTDQIIQNAVMARESILLEGAQATHLGIHAGTYPFVTSSACTSAGLCEGVGLAPNQLHNVVVVAKAYTTRVGGGFFATELNDSVGNQLQTAGKEVGASTGRKRRCGWFDSVVVNQSLGQNGAGELVLTKLDILSGLDEVKICDRYLRDGAVIKKIPWDVSDYERCEPRYLTLPGWKENISGVRKFDDLPEKCKTFVSMVEQSTGTIVGVISVGPSPGQTIVRPHSMLKRFLV